MTHIIWIIVGALLTTSIIILGYVWYSIHHCELISDLMKQVKEIETTRNLIEQSINDQKTNRPTERNN